MKQKESYYHDIHGYIDGELSAEARLAFQENLQRDEELKQRVCEVRRVKQQLQEYYQHIAIPEMRHISDKVSHSIISWGMAATISMLLVGVGFFLGHLDVKDPAQMMVAEQGLNKDKVLLHIDSNDPNKVAHLFKTAQTVLADKDPGVQVEIIANYDGVDLFDKSKKNKNRAAILALLARYDNLKLLACKRALTRKMEMGHAMQVMNKVETDRPAVDEIVDRMQQGWKYHKI